MGNHRILTIFGGAALLASCGTPQQVARPTDVTVKGAILELADTFYEVQQKNSGRSKVGLIVDEASVEFNIAAKSTNKSNVGGEATGLPIGQGGALKLTVANEAFSEGSRGNKVIVKFKNIATADLKPAAVELLDKCERVPRPKICDHIILDFPTPGVMR